MENIKKITTNFEVIIEDFGKDGLIGRIEGIPGLVVQAKTEEEVIKEINISLVTLLNYNLKLSKNIRKNKMIPMIYNLKENYKKLDEISAEYRKENGEYSENLIAGLIDLDKSITRFEYFED